MPACRLEFRVTSFLPGCFPDSPPVDTPSTRAPDFAPPSQWSRDTSHMPEAEEKDCLEREGGGRFNLNPAKVLAMLGLLLVMGTGTPWVAWICVLAPRGPPAAAQPSPPSPLSLAPLHHSSRRPAVEDRHPAAATARLSPRRPRAPSSDTPEARKQSTRSSLHHPLPSSSSSAAPTATTAAAATAAAAAVPPLKPKPTRKTRGTT